MLGIALIATSFAFGGQSVDLTFVQSIPQMLAVLAIAFVLARPVAFAPGARPMLAIAGAIILLVLLQLIPLPYPVWSALPGRAVGVAMLAAGPGGMPWHALSEDPGATLQSALMLLPALAMLLLGLTLDRDGLRRIVLAILACAGVSLLLGWLQMLAGMQSALYVYGDPRALLGLGLFSNRNHQADALCLAMLMAGAALYFLAPRHDALRRHGGAIASGAALLLGFGVACTGSRTGAMQFVPCAVAAIAVALAESHRRRLAPRSLAIMGVAAFAAILLGWIALDQPIARFAAEDLRTSIWPDAWYLATSVWPVGTGFGTFSLAYQQVESLASVTPLLVNAAHDDYLQLLIEGGAPAIAIVIAFLAWFGWQVARLARARAGMTGWFAAGGILLLLVHSAVDYPLRTEALSAVFAALCVILNMAAHPPAAIPSARET